MNKDTNPSSVPPSSGEARKETEEKNEENDHGAGLTGQTIPDAAETEPRPTCKGANGIYVFSQRVRDAVVVAYQMADHDLSNQDAASWLMSAIYDVAIAAHEEMAPPPRPQTPETE